MSLIGSKYFLTVVSVSFAFDVGCSMFEERCCPSLALWERAGVRVAGFARIRCTYNKEPVAFGGGRLILLDELNMGQVMRRFAEPCFAENKRSVCL
jgi:hypothetical protein